MPQPDLALELRELIIGVLGDQSIIDFKEGLGERSTPGWDVRIALSACALVCRHWHNVTLRYTFYAVSAAVSSPRRRWHLIGRRLYTELVELIKANPYIRQCIQDFDLWIFGEVAAEDIDTMCRAVCPVKTLSLKYTGVGSNAEIHDLARASTLHTLGSVLITPHLRDLTLSSNRLSTHLLEVLHNVQSLTLERVSEVVIDHGPKDQDNGAWCSSALEKLVLQPAECVLSNIGAAAESDRDLFAFFEHIRDLELTFNTGRFVHNQPWYAILARWTYLETLNISWVVAEPGDDFLTMCREVPWASFNGLRSLTFSILDQDLDPKQLLDAAEDRSMQIFAGPSRLPQLQDFQFTFNGSSRKYEEEEDGVLNVRWLDAIFHSNLNRTIDDPSSFPSLKTFRVEVICALHKGERTFKVDKVHLAQLLVERLPAVFGPGGRRETQGWAASVEADVSEY